MSAKIRVQNLCKQFGHKVVLNNISFELEEKESLVIIGGSGTGKSVLIKCILGLVKPDSGKIWVNDQEITHLNTAERQKLLAKFGMLFQGGALFDSLTVAQNITFGLTNSGKVSKTEARGIALKKLAAVKLDPLVADIYPAELSGGMQKRAALARAIAAQPEVIFFDEPTTGLDPIVSSTINQLILDCVKELGASTITITHDMQSLRKIASRVALLHQGTFVWSGSVQEMDQTDNPYIKQFIHGEPEGPMTQ